MNIRAYLSYRGDDVQEGEIKMLQEACTVKSIELVWAENETQKGDSFVSFMKDDLTGARFLIIFLSPDYFTTAYTLYEFITVADYISEGSEGLCLYFVPVKKTKEMTLKYLTSIRNTILYDSGTQAEIEQITSLQNKKWSQEEDKSIRNNIFQKIEAGWDELIKPALERIYSSLEENKNHSDFYCEVADLITEQYTKSLQNIREKARGDVTKNLKGLIADTPELKNSLKRALGSSAISDADIVGKIIEADSMASAVYKVSYALELFQEDSGLQPSDRNTWNSTVSKAKQIAGWLVLLSLSDRWWLHNFHLFESRSRLRVPLAKSHQAYGEVIISRSVFQAARFVLDEKGGVVPKRKIQEPIIWDGSQDALMTEFLSPIFRELRRAHVDPANVDEFIELVTQTVEGQFTQNKRRSYFLISGKAYKMIAQENWFEEFTSNLAGKLVFIEIDTDDTSCGHDFCKEDISKLLEAVAAIYRQES